MVTEEGLTQATQGVDNSSCELKSGEYRLNHAASEFVSTDSCSTSTMSVKSEGDEQDNAATPTNEDGNGQHENALSEPEPQAAQATQNASPSRRPMGWESPQVGSFVY